MGRIACILVADFPLAAQLRANPALDGAPAVLADTPAPHADLIAVSPRARSAGIQAGMTIAQARSRVPELIVLARSAAAEQSATDALADVAGSLSPVVEAGPPGCMWLDLAGMGAIHRDENELAAELVRRARRVGLEVAVGVAANPEIARLAAGCSGVRIIAPGMENEFLNWLPMDLAMAADPDDNLLTALARLGIKRLGDLARLEPAAIGSRFGRRAAKLARMARGDGARPLAPRPHGEVYAEAIELDYGVDTLEALGFIMRPMIERIVERLALRGLRGGDISITLGLDDRRIDSRRIAVAAASNDTRAMLALINLRLEAVAPGAAIESVQIEIEARNPRAAQAGLFTPPASAPDSLELTLARLTAFCGNGNVGVLRPENSHRPEAIRLEAFSPAPVEALPSEIQRPPGNVTQLVIRAIRPAMEIEVLCSRGAPEFVRGNNLGGRVISMAGPWRRDGEWWHPAGGFDRDYYELMLEDGGVYRAFCDRSCARWYVDGIYD
jgi:protein ImuB